MIVLVSILVVLIVVFFGILLFLLFLPKDAYVLEKNINQNPRFAVLIPARDESEVIEGILKSIDNQTRKILWEDVFVIVERQDDPTVLICKKYGATVVVRKHLERKSKGYALDEALLFLEEQQKYYDAYFIFDADNIIDKNFFKEMEQDYLKGYAISTGYRGYKNANDSLVASAAGVIYIFINEWINKSNMKKCRNLMLSGTGFYIHGNYIKQFKGYPFHSLCEDVELSYYATLHGLSMHYNSKAIFYDEQPTKMNVSIKQRKRWVRGYFQNWIKNIFPLFKVLKKNPINKGSIWNMIFGVLPLIFFLFIIVLLEILCIILGKIWLSLLVIMMIYLILAFATFLILIKERNRLSMKFGIFLGTIWYHPIFLCTYLWVAFLAFFQKNMTWDKIPHQKI